MTNLEREEQQIRIQKQLASRMRDLDRCIDLYAKIIVEIELLEIEGKRYA